METQQKRAGAARQRAESLPDSAPMESAGELVGQIRDAVSEGNVEGAASVVAKLRKCLSEQNGAASVMDEMELDQVLLELINSSDFAARFGDNLVRFMRELFCFREFDVERRMAKSETLIAIYRNLCLSSRRREIVIDLLGRIGGWSEVCALTFALTNVGAIMVELYKGVDDVTIRDAILAALASVARCLPPGGFESMKCAFDLLSVLVSEGCESSYLYCFVSAVLENGEAWVFMCEQCAPLNFGAMFSVLLVEDVFASTRVAIYEAAEELFRRNIEGAIAAFDWKYVLPDFQSSEGDVVIALCGFIQVVLRMHLCVDEAVHRELLAVIQGAIENGSCAVKIAAVNVTSIVFRFYPEFTTFLVNETEFLADIASCLDICDVELSMAVVESFLYLIDWAQRTESMERLLDYLEDEKILDRLFELIQVVPYNLQVTILELYKLIQHCLTFSFPDQPDETL